jgi:hypothetical protein
MTTAAVHCSSVMLSERCTAATGVTAAMAQVCGGNAYTILRCAQSFKMYGDWQTGKLHVYNVQHFSEACTVIVNS